MKLDINGKGIKEGDYIRIIGVGVKKVIINDSSGFLAVDLGGTICDLANIKSKALKKVE